MRHPCFGCYSLLDCFSRNSQYCNMLTLYLRAEEELLELSPEGNFLDMLEEPDYQPGPQRGMGRNRGKSRHRQQDGSQ